MSEEGKALITADLNPLVPTETARQRLQEIRAFVKEELREGLDADYAVIPGTGRKPSLLQPGADKVCEKLGLAPRFEVTDTYATHLKGEYIIDVHCRLISPQTGYIWAESWGSAARSATEDLASSNAAAAKEGRPERLLTFRDIGLARNAAVKMAQKSAYVGAVLKAARLAVDFTQDIEDMAPPSKDSASVKPRGHFCPIHKVPFFKKGTMRNFAHSYEEAGKTKWCNEPEAKSSRAEPPIDTTAREPEDTPDEGADQSPEASTDDAKVRAINTLYDLALRAGLLAQNSDGSYPPLEDSPFGKRMFRLFKHTDLAKLRDDQRQQLVYMCQGIIRDKETR